MNSSQEIGSRIRHCRRLTGLTRKEFCDRHNLSVNTLSSWERDEVTISEKTALQCIQAFFDEGLNCRSAWLLREEGEAPTVLYSNNLNLPEKFFERDFANVSPEISAFLDVKSYQKNNPGCIVHQIKNKAMLNPANYRKSMTIQKGPELNKGFEKNRQYYISKWGGQPTQETFSTPFNQ